MPILPKREGESESERQVRSHVEDMKNAPDKYPGGRKQAVAIGLDMARRKSISKNEGSHTGGAVDGFHPGMSTDKMKELDRRRGLGDTGPFKDPDVLVNKKPWLKEDGTHKAQEGKMDDSPLDGKLEGLKKYVISSAPPPGAPPMPKPSTGGGMGGSSGGGGGGMPKMGGAPKGPPPIPADAKSYSKDDGDHDKDDDDSTVDRLFGKQPDSMKMAYAKKSFDPKDLLVSCTSMMKALNTRSFYIPPPLKPYDPYGVQNNAMSIPVSNATPIETGPTATAVIPQTVYKSCAVHGITYRSELGCHPCNVAKSTECQTCGAGMMKSFGGVYRCPRGH